MSAAVFMKLAVLIGILGLGLAVIIRALELLTEAGEILSELGS